MNLGVLKASGRAKRTHEQSPEGEEPATSKNNLKTPIKRHEDAGQPVQVSPGQWVFTPQPETVSNIVHAKTKPSPGMARSTVRSRYK